MQKAIEATYDPDTNESVYETRKIWTADDIMVPEDWQGPLPEGFTGVWSEGTEGQDDVAGDETFDPTVLGGERTPVHVPAQGGAPAPNVPGMFGAPPQSMNKAVPGQPGDDDEEEISDMDTTIDLNAMVTPQSPGEQADLDQALAAWAAEYSERNLSPEQADHMLDELLFAAPSEGITIADMRKVLGRSPSWYDGKLRARMRDGRVKKLRTGRYAAGVTLLTRV
jgi:hypothetical protein